jgi:hypothetical protein
MMAMSTTSTAEFEVSKNCDLFTFRGEFGTVCGSSSRLAFIVNLCPRTIDSWYPHIKSKTEAPESVALDC